MILVQPSMHATNKNHFKNYKVAEGGQKVLIRNYNAAKGWEKEVLN
jgi:hypothetical protein